MNYTNSIIWQQALTGSSNCGGGGDYVARDRSSGDAIVAYTPVFAVDTTITGQATGSNINFKDQDDGGYTGRVRLVEVNAAGDTILGTLSDGSATEVTVSGSRNSWRYITDLSTLSGTISAGNRLGLVVGMTAGSANVRTWYGFTGGGQGNENWFAVDEVSAGNASPTLTVNQPDGAGDTVSVGDNFSIDYDLADSDDTVTVAFYYDTNNSGLDGTAISGSCASAAEGTGVTCTWDTTGVTPGSYYVYGITNDGTNPAVSDYSPGQITIDPPPVIDWGACRTENGRTTLTATTGDLPVTLGLAVSDPAKAFVLVDSEDNTTSNGPADDYFVSGYIQNDGSLRFQRQGTTPEAYASYTVVECFNDEIKVQRGEYTLTGNSGSTTIGTPLTTAERNNSIVIVNVRTANTINTDSSRDYVRAAMTANDTITFTRPNSGANLIIRWEVVTFAADVNVYEDTHSFTAAQSTDTDIGGVSASVDPSRSWLYFTATGADADDALQAYEVAGQLDASGSSVKFEHYQNSYLKDVNYYVVEFPAGSVTATRNDTLTNYQMGATKTVDIPISVNANKAFPFVTHSVTGTGDSTPRQRVTSYILNDTTLRNINEQGNSNSAHMDLYWQVIEFNPGGGNSAPTITVNEPNGVSDTVTQGASYSINYDLADSDDVVTAAFFYDTNNSGLDGTAISGACATAAEGAGATCSWDTTGVTPGSYYVYGITNDGTNPAVSDYSPGQITINAPVNSPPTLTVNEPNGVSDTVVVGANYSINYDLADSDDVVTAAFYYDTDNSGLDGTAISGACANAAEGTGVNCTWDTTGVTPGAYYVYGITNDGTNPAVDDYSAGQITINAAPVNTTTAGVANAQRGNALIDVNGPYTDDDNGNNTMLVEWEDCAGSCDGTTFTSSQGLLHSGSPYSYQITGLTNGNSYQVRVTYQDADGVTGTAVQVFTDIMPLATSPMMHNAISTASSKWGGNWGLSGGRYGEFTCLTCHQKGSTNIKRIRESVSYPDGDVMPNGLTSSTVVFLDTKDGSADFGDDSDGRGATGSNRICEVCHSITQQHRATTDTTPVLTHNNNTDCIICHEHSNGFDASCDSCHGNPPPPLNTFAPTGSVTGGQHVLHADSRGFGCGFCHSGSVGSGPTHKQGGTISIGFQPFGAYTGGNYDGQSGVSYDSSDGFTTVSATGAKTCSNIYCHGSTLTGGVDTSPVWDGTVACGDCHGDDAATPPTAGSHQLHAGSAGSGLSLPCSDCHNGAVPGAIPSGMLTHVDNLAQFSFDSGKSYIAGGNSYSGTTTMLDAYGNCTVYCHSNVQASGGSGAADNYSTPTWGSGAQACDSCHGQAGQGNGRPSSGSHVAHNYACSTCHTGGGDGTANHYNGTINIDIDNIYDGAGTAAYSQGSHTPGSGGYGTCSNVSCHNSTTTPTWGGSATCSTCHGQGAGVPWPNVGKHNDHFAAFGIASLSDAQAPAKCDYCHTGAGSGTAAHANGTTDDVSIAGTFDDKSAGTPNYTGGVNGTCSNISCHGGQTTPTWSSAANSIDLSGSGATLTAECQNCHATGSAEYNGLQSGKHATHLAAAINCDDCHNAQPTGHFDDAELATTAMQNPDNLVPDPSAPGTYTDSTPGGFNSNGVSGSCNNMNCHSTADWDQNTVGGCNFCHGYPPTSAADPANNKHVGPTPVFHDIALDGVTSAITGNHSECNVCHGKSDANGETDNTGSGGDQYLSSYHRDGNIEMNGISVPDNGQNADYQQGSHGCAKACHANDAAHQLSDSGFPVQLHEYGAGGSCDACHDVNSGHATAPKIVDVTGASHNGAAYGTHLQVTIGEDLSSVSNWASQCGQCHEMHTGPVFIANNPAVGINYTDHGGIYLGGPSTNAMINTKTTEAEICWGCHYPQGISEFNAMGDYGYTVIGPGGWAGEWRADLDFDLIGNSVPTRKTNSMHTANNIDVESPAPATPGVGVNATVRSSSISNNLDWGSNPYGAVRKEDPATMFEDTSAIRCSYCHDVHGTADYTGVIATADDPDGHPFIRGTFMINPYPDERPPEVGDDYPGNTFPGMMNGASTTRAWPAGVNMPRLYANSAASQVIGGFFIDQNSGYPTYNSTLGRYLTVDETAGVCVLCHGNNVDTMDYYTADNLWNGVNGNGHSNSTVSGTGLNASNLFDANNGAAAFRMHGQGLPTGPSNGSRAWGDTNSNNQNVPFGGHFVAAERDVQNGNMLPPRNTGWYGGTDGNDNRLPSANYTAWYSTNGIGSNGDGITSRAHSFSCSKCHAPHSSGLPALLITNCLDPELGTWSNSQGSTTIGPGAWVTGNEANTRNRWTFMGNCHRKENNTTSGWNNLAPAQ